MLNIAFFCKKEHAIFFRIKFEGIKSCNVLFVFDDENTQVSADEYCFRIEKDHDYTFLDEYEIELVLVYGWKHLIPEGTLDRIDVYNVHPSLLPKYRGPYPILFQLLNGETTVGVTLHKMNKCFDAGDIYKQEEFSIIDIDNLNRINMIVLKKAIEMISSLIKDYISSPLNLSQQDHTQATYYSKKDLDKFIINSTYTYKEFCRMVNIFKDYFPLKIQIDLKVCEIKRFNLNPFSGSIKFKLLDKLLFLEI